MKKIFLSSTALLLCMAIFAQEQPKTTRVDDTVISKSSSKFNFCENEFCKCDPCLCNPCLCEDKSKPSCSTDICDNKFPEDHQKTTFCTNPLCFSDPCTCNTSQSHEKLKPSSKTDCDTCDLPPTCNNKPKPCDNPCKPDCHKPKRKKHPKKFLFAFDTSKNQRLSGFQANGIKFDHPQAEANCWKYDPKTQEFFCNKSGLFKIEYSISVFRVTPRSQDPDVSVRATLNGIEIPGTKMTIVFANDGQSGQIISNQFILNYKAGDKIRFQAASTNAHNDIIISSILGGTSASVVITPLPKR